MASRKPPSSLSARHIRRKVAEEKAKPYEEVEIRLAQYKQSHDAASVMQVEGNQEAADESENLVNLSQDNLDDIEYSCLLKDLCKPDSSQDFKNELKEVHHIVPGNVQNQEEIIKGTLISEDTCQHHNFDFFDIMKDVLSIDDETADFDCENDYQYFDFLTSLDKKDPQMIFMNEIRQLCIRYIHTIPHVFINDLLDKLRKETGYPFPKDARTFLKTPRESVVRKMGEGQYCHYGVESAVKTFLGAYKQNSIKTYSIKLIVNIDGALLVKSSEDTSWIITISETILNLVEVVGIYDGPKKPDDSNDLVNVFVDELTDLINTGIEFEKQNLKVSLQCLVCDAPVKAYVIKTKLYSGYFSCSKCTIQGDYRNKVYFPTRMQESAILRTDEKFIAQEYEPNKAVFDEFQMGKTNMKKIPNFRPITDVVLDYMHLVCLGIMLKLIELWIRNSKCVLSEYERKQISDRLLRFKEFIPHDFNRNPRQFKNVGRFWKAHELRTFLLYTGPIALYDILPQDLYLNFLCLHVAISILVNPILCKNEEYLNYAEQLLISFVNSYEKCYGEINMVFNVHNLLHLVLDVRNFGCLDSFSAFRFENHIRKVKQLIRKGDNRLQQIANRLMEIKAAKVINDEVDSEETNFLLIPEMELFEVVNNNSIKIDCRNQKDKYVLIDNGTYLECHYFIKINGQVYVEGHPLKIMDSFYQYPLRSNILSINVIQPASMKKSKQRHLYENILAKICRLPLERIEKESTDEASEKTSIEKSIIEEFVAVPLIHTYRQT